MEDEKHFLHIYNHLIFTLPKYTRDVKTQFRKNIYVIDIHIFPHPPPQMNDFKSF